MAIAVSEAGGLGALPCAMLRPEQIRSELELIRAATSKPINLNFLCHRTPGVDMRRDDAWRRALARFYVELGLDPNAPPPPASRTPFDGAMCDVVAEGTVLTNVFTGRPARGIANRLVRELGPMSDIAPAFPLASGPVLPLRAKAEASGSGDFSPLWSGQASALGRDLPVGELTTRLAREALAMMAVRLT